MVRSARPSARPPPRRIYTLPDEPPAILASGFGEKATSLAARIGDGYINTAPAADLLVRYRAEGGKGPPVAVMKVCYGADEPVARKLAFDLWPTTGISGELSQVLPMPAHFEQACATVEEDDILDAIVCGPDPERHTEMIQRHLDAGFDEVHVKPDRTGPVPLFRFSRRAVLPRLGR